jgi:hypothetical protein
LSFHRWLYLCAWTAVALLAIVGFAAFSAGRSLPPATTATGAVTWGSVAGAVAGQGWTALAGTRATTAVVATVEDDSAELSPLTTTVSSLDTGWLDSRHVRSMVEIYFASADVNRAVRLAWCVSRFDADGVDPGSGAAGLFRIHPASWLDLAPAAGLPATASALDPEASTAVAAYIVYRGEGWGFWHCD